MMSEDINTQPSKDKTSTNKETEINTKTLIGV